VIAHLQAHFGHMPRVMKVFHEVPHPPILLEQFHRLSALGRQRHFGQWISMPTAHAIRGQFASSLWLRPPCPSDPRALLSARTSSIRVSRGSITRSM